ALFALQPGAGERLPRPASIWQLLAADFRIAPDSLIGAAQNRRSRAPVFRHGHALDAVRAKGPQKLVEGPAGCAAKTIDRLIGIADGEDVRRIAREQFRKFDLRDI